MATATGSIDLKSLNNLRDDLTQYFWFESNSSATYGAGVHITLSPEPSFITSPTGQNILINTDGISIRNGLLPMMVLDNDSLDFNTIDTTNNTYTNVASFGAISTIGVTDGTQSYLSMDYRSMQYIDKEGNTYFYVGDLRDSSGYATITETFTVTESTNTFYVQFYIQPNTTTTATVDGVAVSVTYDSMYEVEISPAAQAGQTIVITYQTASSGAKVYTFGRRTSGSVVGAYSFVEGAINTASGSFSHAEGSSTTASGSFSHAEGRSTTASGGFSHASGDSTIASSYASFATGHWNDNTTLVARVPNGTIFDVDGEPSSIRYPLLWIGNGTDPSFDNGGRSNALTLDSLGNLAIGWKLTMCNHSSPIGTTMRDSFTASLASGTSLVQIYPSTGKINMPAGSWIINYSTRFPSNATGRRGASIYINDGSMGASYMLSPPVNGEQTALTGSIVWESPSSSFTLGFGARQNSGSTQTVTVYWDAIRIA